MIDYGLAKKFRDPRTGFIIKINFSFKKFSKYINIGFIFHIKKIEICQVLKDFRVLILI